MGFHYDPLVFDRTARRRIGSETLNRDSRTLRRQGALGGRDGTDSAQPASRSEVTEETLSFDLGQMVLSDGEENQEVDAPARVRRLLQRASSDVELGHADAGLAARLERATVTSPSVPPAQGVGQVSAQVEGTVAGPAPTRVSTTRVGESSGSSATQPAPASASASGANAPDPAPEDGAVVHGLRRSTRIRDKGKGTSKSKGAGKR